jgi:alpha-galactosidase
MDDFTRSLLTNDEVLAVDQDPLGKEATQIAETDSVRIYEKDLADGSKAVGLFNVSTQPASINLDLSALGITGEQKLRDLWRQKNIGTFTGSYEAKNIPSHGVLLLKITAMK